MKEIILRPYQEKTYQEIMEALKTNDSVLGVCETGWGKSVAIGKLCQDLPGRTLVLTHREEILKQNGAWIDNVGLLSGTINTLAHSNKVVVAMVQTLDARIKKYGIEYLGSFDNLILDECHILIFEKVYKQYNHKKLIGFTATPIVYKKINTTVDDVEFVQDYSLDQMFDVMVQGVDVPELIEMGNLIQDHNIVLDLPDFDLLKTSESAKDGYTEKSLTEVYSNQASLDMVIKAYNAYGRGKKTLIFNANTKINEVVNKRFLEEGINVKMLDSVNGAGINPKTGRKYNRTQLLEWFDEEDDAVLINTGVLTTGFSNNEVECIILNRATKSLSLFRQIVGRGARPSKKIFKDFFTMVDLGGNIFEHGEWSTPVDWSSYFETKPPKRKRLSDMLSVWECPECFFYNEVGETVCENCGEEKKDVVVKKNKKEKDGELVELKPKPIPSGKSIVRYAESKGQDSTFAFKVLDKAILELFKHHQVNDVFYIRNKDKFDARVLEIYRKAYFVIINSELKGVNRTLNNQTQKILNKIEKQYGYSVQ